MINCLLSLLQLVTTIVIDRYSYLLLTGVVTPDLLWEAKLLLFKKKTFSTYSALSL